MDCRILFLDHLFRRRRQTTYTSKTGNDFFMRRKHYLHRGLFYHQITSDRQKMGKSIPNNHTRIDMDYKVIEITPTNLPFGRLNIAERDDIDRKQASPDIR